MESEDTVSTTTTDDIDPQCDELIKTIIDVIQDFISARKIDLNNNEPLTDGWPDPSLIYGSDFDELYDGILSTLDQWGFVF